MKKKILFVVSSSCGGAERMTLTYAKILKSHGYDCHLLVYQNRKKDFLLKPFIPETLSYDVIRCMNSLLILYICLYLNKYKPDIVFCSQPGNALRLVKLRKWHLIDTKIVFRDFLMATDYSPSKVAENKELSRADCIIAQTKEMAEAMVNVYGWKTEQITTIYNPLDKQYIHNCLKDNTPLKRNNVNFVAMNRVSAQKDILTMLKAFNICKDSIDNAHLYILGSTTDKEYVSSVEEFINMHNLSESVHIEGLQKNPYKYLKDADAFVMSSLYEGLPNAMLEAMYLGIPVAVTRSIPFIELTVKDGLTGYTVPTSNPEALAEAMRKASKLKNLTKYNDITNSENQVIDVFEKL